jgi:hypothetical protein
MSLIVAARFDTFDAAQNAATALMNAGVGQDDLHTFFVNPAGQHNRYPTGGDQAADPDSKGAPFGAIGGAAALGVLGAVVGGVIAASFAESVWLIIPGAGVGAYIGSLAGSMSILGRARRRRSIEEATEEHRHEGRKSGVVLAVHTAREHEKRIASLLREAGGVEVERAQGRWRDGKWEDFDPLVAPELEKNF